MKSFYEHYFAGRAGPKYVNEEKNFQSYFLSFASGARLELMCRPDIASNARDMDSQQIGLIHFAFSVGGNDQVDELTKRLRSAGYRVVDGPRTTGDGYYESCIIDPEGNRIEITI